MSRKHIKENESTNMQWGLFKTQIIPTIQGRLQLW